MQRVLIVGISSFIGSNVALYFRSRYRLYGTYHRQPPRLDGIPCVRFPIQPGAPIRELMHRIRPDVVIYCAAERDARRFETHPRQSEFVNADAAYEFAGAFPNDEGKLIYLSSSKVFSGSKGQYQEDEVPDPGGPYGNAKVRAEEMLSHRSNVTILRLGTVYGLGSHFHEAAILRRILTQLQQGPLCEFVSDEYRSFLSVLTLARTLAIVTDAKLIRAPLFHMGGPEKISYFDFAREVCTAFGIDGSRLAPISGNAFGGEHALSGGFRGNDLTLSNELFSQLFSFRFPPLGEELRVFHNSLRHGTQ